jgi:hypothetical protein
MPALGFESANVGADVTYRGLAQVAGDGAAGWELAALPSPLPVVPVAG